LLSIRRLAVAFEVFSDARRLTGRCPRDELFVRLCTQSLRTADGTLRVADALYDDYIEEIRREGLIS